MELNERLAESVPGMNRTQYEQRSQRNDGCIQAKLKCKQSLQYGSGALESSL